MEDELTLNRNIHNFKAGLGEKKIFPIGETNGKRIEYVNFKVKSDKGWLQKDELQIYKDNELVASHQPELDPYVTFKGNILCMTSDGECWVYDLDTGKENTIKMPIVAFYHNIDFDTKYQRQNIPNTFVISGEGCYWACEAWPQEFEIYIDKDTLEQKRQDVWDEEDGYDAYIKELEEEE